MAACAAPLVDVAVARTEGVVKDKATMEVVDADAATTIEIGTSTMRPRVIMISLYVRSASRKAIQQLIVGIVMMKVTRLIQDWLMLLHHHILWIQIGMQIGLQIISQASWRN
jgi:hypothetical protein